MRTSLRAAIALLCCLLLPSTAASAAASDPAPQEAVPAEQNAEEAWLGESVDVRVVNIDVRVTDRAGHRVEDLTREDFLLEEDGKPVPIVNFEAPPTTAGEAAGSARPVEASDAGASAPPASAAARVAARRQAATTIIFFDDIHLSGTSRARVVAGLRERLQAGDLGERLALVNYDGHGLAVRAPLGTSSADVAAALAAMPAPFGVKASSELRSMLQTLRDMQRAAFESSHWAQDPPCSMKIAQGALNYGTWARSEAQATLAAAGQLLDSLAALPGPKLMLFVTDGLPLQPALEGLEAFRVLCDGTGLRQGLQYAVDVDTNDALRENPLVYNPRQAALSSAGLNIASDLQSVSTRANTAGVQMVTVQATGLSAGNAEAAESSNRTTTQEERNAAVENARDSLTELASETGGEALLNINDFGAAIADTVRDWNGSYSLGFSPIRAGDDRVHTLHLAVRRPGLTLRYRRNYRDLSAATQITQQLVGSLLHGLWRDPWGVGLELHELPGGAVLNLSLPMSHLAALPDRAGAMHGSLTIFMALRAEDGTITPVRQVRVPFALPKERTPTSQYAYGIRVKRSPGLHTVALLVRDDLSADTVLLHRQFRVPTTKTDAEP